MTSIFEKINLLIQHETHEDTHKPHSLLHSLSIMARLRWHKNLGKMAIT